MKLATLAAALLAVTVLLAGCNWGLPLSPEEAARLDALAQRVELVNSTLEALETDLERLEADGADPDMVAKIRDVLERTREERTHLVEAVRVLRADAVRPDGSINWSAVLSAASAGSLAIPGWGPIVSAILAALAGGGAVEVTRARPAAGRAVKTTRALGEVVESVERAKNGTSLADALATHSASTRTLVSSLRGKTAPDRFVERVIRES